MISLTPNPLTPTRIHPLCFCAAEDIGHKPFVDSWIERLECDDYKPLLTALFSKYVDAALEHCRRNFKTVVPLPAINQVQTLCKVGHGEWGAPSGCT